jgi:Tle cognate immunity protein 4 C-terminal domain
MNYMRNHCLRRASRRVVFGLLACCFASCSAKEQAIDWRTDCVGRMQVSLAGEAEVAAQTAQSWTLPGSGGYERMRFADGQLAGWSDSFPFKISHPLTENEMRSVTKHSEWTPSVFAEQAKAISGFDKKSFRTSPTNSPPGTSWGYRYSISGVGKQHEHFLVQIGGSAVQWTTVSIEDASAAEAKAQDLIQRLSPRPTSSTPTESGVCYPYMFVKDGGQLRRQVATTYRLKEHPDITVLLQDKTADPLLKNERSQHRSAVVASDSFWTNRYPAEREVVESLWSDPYQRTKLAGYNGVESYVEIKRADGTIDYGYYVSVRGSAEAKEDEPDMTLYVIRESSVAKAKGVLPYGDEKTFLALAKSIATSVKRRPTK